jgi:hypothetical protein
VLEYFYLYLDVIVIKFFFRYIIKKNLRVNSLLYSLFGFQPSNNFHSLSDFSFFNQTHTQKLILDKFDISDKYLFSGLNSNLISIEGKLLEIEELYLSTHVSLDKFILSYNNIVYKNISSIYQNIKITLDNISNVEIQYNSSSLLLENIYNTPLYVNIFDNINKIKEDLYNSLFSYLSYTSYFDKIKTPSNDSLFEFESSKLIEITESKYNNILNMDLDFQESSFYKRRFLRMSFFFNPYLEIFDTIFSLNQTDYVNNSYKDPGNYK